MNAFVRLSSYTHTKNRIDCLGKTAAVKGSRRQVGNGIAIYATTLHYKLIHKTAVWLSANDNYSIVL